jgi:hypothetical protein
MGKNGRFLEKRAHAKLMSAAGGSAGGPVLLFDSRSHSLPPSLLTIPEVASVFRTGV